MWTAEWRIILQSAAPVSQRSRVWITCKPVFFFTLTFCNCKSCVYNCDDLHSYNSNNYFFNTRALWFHDMFYDQNRLLLAHAFNILSPITGSCLLNWWPCSHLLLHYTYLHITWLPYVFYRQVRKFNSEVPLLKKSKLTQLDCLSHFILKEIQFTGYKLWGGYLIHAGLFFLTYVICKGINEVYLKPLTYIINLSINMCIIFNQKPIRGWNV